MIIDCISDLHGEIPELEGGDLLIVAGDLTSTDETDEYVDFFEYLLDQRYKDIVVISGNHDNTLQNTGVFTDLLENCPHVHYLEDKAVTISGIKIYGMPWTVKFSGQNRYCMAFAVNSESEMEEKCKLIPEDVDILVTHSPPFGILDQSRFIVRCGSESLLKVTEKIKPKLHVFGHIHEGYGVKKIDDTVYVNAAYMNWAYDPVNEPIRIVYDDL